MKRHRFLLVMSICFAVVIVAICCIGIIAPFLLAQPSAEALVTTYLHAVTTGDANEAMAMAWIDESCRANMKESFERDSAGLRGAEIRNVQVQVKGGGGSDNSLTIAVVQLDYRLPPHTEWQTAEFDMASDSQSYLTRYSCGTRYFKIISQ
jgi:hypothetical protein